MERDPIAICSSLATGFPLSLPLPEGQGLASLAFAIGPAADDTAPMPEGCNIQLLPDGAFAAPDGRPGSLPGVSTRVWRMDAEIAAALIAELAGHKTPRLLDYEHQTLLTEKNGKPAPASGWMRNYTYVPGRGLFAFADWTARAKAHIEAGEYRFISPVFTFCRKTGRVSRLLHAALTHYPALDGMAPVAPVAASGAGATLVPDNALAVMAGSLFSQPSPPPIVTDQEDQMDDIKKMLGLPLTATEAEVHAALRALQAKMDESEAAARAASEQGQTHLDALAQLTAQVAAMSQRDAARQLDDAIAAAKRDGKLIAALEPWARDLGTKDFAALTAYLDTVQPVAALTGMQTGGSDPDGNGNSTAALTAAEKYMAVQFGLSEEEYRTQYKPAQGGK